MGVAGKLSKVSTTHTELEDFAILGLAQSLQYVAERNTKSERRHHLMLNQKAEEDASNVQFLQWVLMEEPVFIEQVMDHTSVHLHTYEDVTSFAHEKKTTMQERKEGEKKKGKTPAYLAVNLLLRVLELFQHGHHIGQRDLLAVDLLEDAVGLVGDYVIGWAVVLQVGNGLAVDCVQTAQLGDRLSGQIICTTRALSHTNTHLQLLQNPTYWS